MKKELKELIKILEQEDTRRQLLEELVKVEMKRMLKELLEEVAVVEREAYCEETGEVGNGFYPRSLAGLFGKLELRIPRTREGGFRPFFVEPYKRVGFQLEELVIAMYQGGCSTRDISRTITALLEEKYSASWVSRITEVVEEKVEAFRNRRLAQWYPIVFLDGAVIKIRRGSVEGEVSYIALGIDGEGHKEVLGFWLMGSEGESSEIWKEILVELKGRGLEEPLLFIGDGLTGLPEAVKEVYPRADFQSCLVHKVRSSLNKVRKRDREAVSQDLKRIYRQPDEAGFLRAWEDFKKKWGFLYPEVIKSWERDLSYLMSYLRYPEEIRKYIYSTNSLERFIKEVKRRTKVIEVFPNPGATAKVLYLVSSEMNERYQRRTLNGFSLAIDALLSIRRQKYQLSSQQREPCHTQKS